VSWRDRRDSEWQTAIYRWRAMLSTWDRKVQITEQVFAVKVFHRKPKWWWMFFTTELLLRS